MKNNLYVVMDLVAEQSGFIHESVNDNTALREFAKFLAAQEGRESDFRLVCIGSFDHETCELVVHEEYEVQPKFELEEDSE